MKNSKSGEDKKTIAIANVSRNSLAESMA